VNTHYAVVTFGGDPASEYCDDELRGRAPHMELIACGSEDFCWKQLARWTAHHPLGMWQEAEVLARDPVVIRAQAQHAAAREDDRG